MKTFQTRNQKNINGVKQIEQQLEVCTHHALHTNNDGTAGAYLQGLRKWYDGIQRRICLQHQNAVTGNSPDFEVDYQKVLLVSRGSLPNRGQPAVAKGTDDNLVFTWTDNSGMGKALATDKTVLVIYLQCTRRYGLYLRQYHP